MQQQTCKLLIYRFFCFIRFHLYSIKINVKGTKSISKKCKIPLQYFFIKKTSDSINMETQDIEHHLRWIKLSTFQHDTKI